MTASVDMPPSCIAVSVIVPVWNGASSIRACLDAINAQTIGKGCYEIIVVDNGSTDRTIEIVSEFRDVCLLSEPEGGSYRARNAGIAAASGRCIAFTDADCIPNTDWLERALACLAEAGPDVGVVAGEIRVEGTATRAARLYESVFAFRQAYNIQRGHCVTANWLSPAEVLNQAGRFDSTATSGGDWRLSRRISELGYRLVLAPHAIVSHPPRASVGEIARKRRRVAGGRWSASGKDRLARAVVAEVRDLARKLVYTARVRGPTLRDKLELCPVLMILCAHSVHELYQLSRGAPPSRT